jgi:nitroreductase
VPEEVIGTILENAQQAPSWCNAQPWQVIVTAGEGTARFREEMFRYASTHSAPSSDFPFPREYVGEYLQRRRESGFQLYSAMGVERGNREAAVRQALQNFRFFGAPHVAIVTTHESLGVYGAVDCGAYVSNFLLAAQASGVATIAQAAIASHSSFVREYFRLSDERKVVCAISFGYRDASHPANSYRTTRAQVSDIVTWVRE